MRWFVALLIVLLSACSAAVDEIPERPDVVLASVSESNASEFAYELIECSDSRLFQGAFIPFSVSVDERTVVVEDHDYELRNETCVSFDYVLDQDLREDLLGHGSFTIHLDPYDTINESDEENNRVVYEPERVCIDADGDNPFLSSFVTASIDGESLFMLDRCGNATATEFTCDGSGRIEPMLYNCSNGCVSGSCRCTNSQTCLSDGSATRI